MRNLIGSALALLCFASAACGRGEQPPPSKGAATGDAPAAAGHTDPNAVRVDPTMLRDLRVTTAAVEERPGGEDVILLGELGVDEGAYAEVGVPISARVVRLLAGPGDVVRAGQTLVELQSPELSKARAEYLSAEARLALAEAALKRKRDLAAERIAPEREVQEAEAAAAEARAALRAATAALSAFGVSPPKPGESDAHAATSFELRSPVAGAVIERRAMVGQMLDPGVPAFRIANLSSLWLTVHAFERDAVRVATGASAKLSFPALPGQDFQGTVSLVGREVAKESRTVPVRIVVRNRNNLLRPGMSASAAVPVGAETKILTVPVAAVQRVRNEWCVFLPKESSVFEIRKIGRGRDLGTEVEILSGLRAGETIVVDGAFLLKSQAEKSDAGHGGRP